MSLNSSIFIKSVFFCILYQCGLSLYFGFKLNLLEWFTHRKGPIILTAISFFVIFKTIQSIQNKELHKVYFIAAACCLYSILSAISNALIMATWFTYSNPVFQGFVLSFLIPALWVYHGNYFQGELNPKQKSMIQKSNVILIMLWITYFIFLIPSLLVVFTFGTI